MKTRTGVRLLFAVIALPSAAVAGNLNPPGLPASGSGMPTLQQLHAYLTQGQAPNTTGAFKEPTTAPGATMYTLQEVYDAFSALVAQCDATPADVQSGKTFFSTDSANWGPQIGTMKSDKVKADETLTRLSQIKGAFADYYAIPSNTTVALCASACDISSAIVQLGTSPEQFCSGCSYSDAWGTPIQYTATGFGDMTLISYGADGTPGGSACGCDTDLVLLVSQ